MKTFKQFQYEASEKDPFNTYAKINDYAAKEYAKQWIEEAFRIWCNKDVYEGDYILDLRKKIDRQ
jgi:hypothetical protein